MEEGLMDRKIIADLINSISRFILVASCKHLKIVIDKDFNSIIGMLKLLKPVLDEAIDSPIASDEQHIKAFEELDSIVNEAREVLEKRPQIISKIYSVLLYEPTVTKVQNLSIEICHFLSKLLQSSIFTSLSVSIQEFRCRDQVLKSQLIESALKDLKDNATLGPEYMQKIMESFSLTSSQELLMECISLEKERDECEMKKNSQHVDEINQIISLVTQIRYYMGNLERFVFLNGLPVPSYFRCPLSLELMIDPVIVCSGQTYEKSYIRKWLDNGLTICPVTRQTLSHFNLVQNDTVTVLIANWCKSNGIRFYGSVFPEKNPNPFLSNLVLETSSPENGFHCTFNGCYASRSSYGSPNQTKLTMARVSLECEGEESCMGCNVERIPDKVSLQDSVSHRRQSSCQSLAESISSTISSVETTCRFDDKARLLGDITNSSSSVINDVGSSPHSSPDICSVPGAGLHINVVKSITSFQASEFSDVSAPLHIKKLVEDLRSKDYEVQAVAASELRLLTKHDMNNRIVIAKCGAISSLLSLSYSKIKRVQENAVTALLNISINEDNKILIARAGAIEPLVHVLESGNTEAKENAAATLFVLSLLEDCKVNIGRSGAVRALVNLLASGSLRGKNDAAKALFNLSISYENRARIVQAGAVKYLVEFLDSDTGMVDKSLALLANLSTTPEGRIAIVQENGIPLLVYVIETGSERGKENATSALFQLCINNQAFSSMVLQEGAVPPLIALSQFGTPRAKEKSQQILSHFRSQREGVVGRTR